MPTMSYLVCGTAATGGGSWAGVLRRGRRARPLTQCGHDHPNRDRSTGANGPSADACMRQLVRAAVDQQQAADLRADLRSAAARSARLGLFTPRQLADMDAHAEDAVAALDVKLAELSALIGGEPVLASSATVLLAPRPVVTAPCPECGTTLQRGEWAPDPSGSGPGRWGSWWPVKSSVFTGPPECINGDLRHTPPTCEPGPVS